jgi:hypothetical protein
VRKQRNRGTLDSLERTCDGVRLLRHCRNWLPNITRTNPTLLLSHKYALSGKHQSHCWKLVTK